QRGKAMEAGPTACVLGTPRNDYTRRLLQSRPKLLATAAASSESTREDILSVSDLSASYPGQGPLSPRIQGLDNVDFALRRGDALAIVGESGSGKSTLGKVLVGLVAPERGRIRFDGRELRPTRMTTADRQSI